MRVLEGQDHGRLVGLVVVRLDRQLARAGLYYFMLDDVLLPRAREARETPGRGRSERAREDEAAHRAAFLAYSCVRACFGSAVTAAHGRLIPGFGYFVDGFSRQLAM